MININLDIDGEVTQLSTPQEWAEVTVGQSIRINSIDKEGKSELALIVSILSILTGIEEEILWMLSPEQFMELSEVIKFTNQEIVGTKVDSVMVGEEEYFLKKDFEKLTLGEIISIETIMKQSDGNLTDAMGKLLCIFLRKKKPNGNLETFRNSFMDREEQFMDLKITDVNNVFIFFLDGNHS